MANKLLKTIIPRPIRRFWRTYRKNQERQYRLRTASQRTGPDFIIIGAQKSGSSTLYHWLDQHPNICMSFDKESRYWDRYHHQTFEWYRHQFPLASEKGNTLAGDNTPYYIFHPLVPQRIAETIPKVKLIAILRDPVNRAYSQYQMERRKGREQAPTFEQAIEGEHERLEKAKRTLLANPDAYEEAHHLYENTSYLSRGLYGEQLERWLQFFPKEQLLVLNSEDFYAQPAINLEEVYQFLGLETILPKDFTPHNVRTYAQLDPNTRSRLHTFYQADKEKLSGLLNLKTMWWS